MYTNQGTHGTGKTGKMAKKIPVRENTGNLEMLSKHREFFQNTVNALILKVKYIVIFAAKKKNHFFPEAR